jgi:hypothetical protein
MSVTNSMSAIPREELEDMLKRAILGLASNITEINRHEFELSDYLKSLRVIDPEYARKSSAEFGLDFYNPLCEEARKMYEITLTGLLNQRSLREGYIGQLKHEIASRLCLN